MDIEKLREDIRNILLTASHKREAEAREVDRENVTFIENLKGKAIGLHEAYYLVEDYLKQYEGDKKGNT